jgi:ATP-dependent protease ClpP protease subunit
MGLIGGKMTTHFIHFTGPINSATCGSLIEACSKAIQQDASKLVITVATMGGECSYGFAIYNFLRSLPVPVHTHNLGTVESMGNIVFLAGDRRTACQHSKFLFHPFHWNLHGSIDHSRMSEYAMSLDYDLAAYAHVVAERTQGAVEPLDIGKYLQAAARILNPTEAVMSGLIDEIADLRIIPGSAAWCVHS